MLVWEAMHMGEAGKGSGQRQPELQAREARLSLEPVSLAAMWREDGGRWQGGGGGQEEWVQPAAHPPHRECQREDPRGPYARTAPGEELWGWGPQVSRGCRGLQCLQHFLPGHSGSRTCCLDSYKGDLCIRPAERAKETLCPAGTGGHPEGEGTRRASLGAPGLGPPGGSGGSSLPGRRGSRVCDGHSSTSSGGAPGPAGGLTSTVTEPSEKEKSSLLPW